MFAIIWSFVLFSSFPQEPKKLLFTHIHDPGIESSRMKLLLEFKLQFFLSIFSISLFFEPGLFSLNTLQLFAIVKIKDNEMYTYLQLTGKTYVPPNTEGFIQGKVHTETPSLKIQTAFVFYLIDVKDPLKKETGVSIGLLIRNLKRALRWKIVMVEALVGRRKTRAKRFSHFIGA